MNNKFQRVSYVFYLSFLVLFGIFIFYSPVTFLPKSETTQLGNRLIILVFFALIGILAFCSFLSMDKSRKRNMMHFDQVLTSIDNFNAAAVDQEYYKIRNFFLDTILKNNWLKYEKTLRRIQTGINDEGEIKEKYYATIESGYFFNEEAVYNNIAYYKINNYIPQLLTAIGICGTFLGLVVGLIGLDFTDTSNTKSSIELLLNGVQISFRTSIYGISFSLLLTVFQKFILGQQETMVRLISDKIDGLFQMNTQPDGVNQLYLELEKQTASIQKMGTDVAEAVANKFDASLQNTLGPALVRLGETTEQLFEVVKLSNHNAISSIVDNIGSIISSSAGSELERLRDSLGTLTERNDRMLANFEKTIQNLEEVMQTHRAVITETNESAANARQLNDNISIVTAELIDIVGGLQRFASIQQNSNDEYKELINKVKETIEDQDKLVQVFKETMQYTSQVLDSQKFVSENLSHTVHNLTEFNSNFEQVLKNITNSITTFDEASAKITERFIITMNDLERTHEKLSIAIEKLSFGLNDSIDNLEQKVFRHLREIDNRYLEVINQLANFSEKSDRVANELSEFSSTNQTSLELWRSYKESFDSLNSEIKQGITDYTFNVREGLQNLFKDYDEHISKVLGDLKSTIQGFEDSLEELKDILDEQNMTLSQEQTSKVLHEFTRVIDSFGNRIQELKEVYQQTAVFEEPAVVEDETDDY